MKSSKDSYSIIQVRWNCPSLGKVLEARSQRNAEPAPGDAKTRLGHLHIGVFARASIFLFLRIPIRLHAPAVRLTADRQPPH